MRLAEKWDKKQNIGEKRWVRRDLNPQPKDYESSALTVELLTRMVSHLNVAKPLFELVFE